MTNRLPRSGPRPDELSGLEVERRRCGASYIVTCRALMAGTWCQRPVSYPLRDDDTEDAA